MIDNPTCQHGQTTREEYRAGIRRELCTRPSAGQWIRVTPAGTDYVVHLCATHGVVEDAIVLIDEARAMAHGEGMTLRYARRQGFTGETLVEAAHFLAKSGRTFRDVLRAAS